MKTKAYACINKNDVVRLNSSSGGVYTLLAEEIISEGGCVFAAAFDENLCVKHIKINKIEDIEKGRGAKYVASDFTDAVREAKCLLQDGKKVMFTGTPCECAAMIECAKGYRNNLLCVDCVCHGAPDKKIWNLYLESLKKRKHILQHVNMRCKKTGWARYQYCWEMKYSDGTVHYEKADKNPYMNGFTKNYFLRSSCYSCKHKGFSRNTDISLGDFWGVWDIKPHMNDGKGTSLVLVHSQIGVDYFSKISQHMIYEEVTEEEAVRNNQSIIVSAKKNCKADDFEKNISKGKDFISVMQKLEKENYLRKIIWRFTNK